jgi:hypothetical protein
MQTFYICFVNSVQHVHGCIRNKLNIDLRRCDDPQSNIQVPRPQGDVTVVSILGLTQQGGPQHLENLTHDRMTGGVHFLKDGSGCGYRGGADKGKQFTVPFPENLSLPPLSELFGKHRYCKPSFGIVSTGVFWDGHNGYQK